MRTRHAAFLFAATMVTMFASAPARAGTADDARWIAQCVRDNRDEGQPGRVVAAYCACMVDLMPESETRSVTQWEKTHKREENRCGRKAGWRDR